MLAISGSPKDGAVCDVGAGRLVNQRLRVSRKGITSLTEGRPLANPSAMKIRQIVAALVAALFLVVAPAARADVKVAVIDVQRAVMQTEDGLRAQASLKKMFDSRQQELNKTQQDLAKEKDDLEKQSKTLSQAAMQKRAEDWQKKMMSLQQVFVDYNKELEKKQKELTDPIFEKVMAIVKRLATAEGFDMVMDKQTVAYARADLDLTDRAIQMYNSGGAPIAPAPGGQAPAAPAAPKK
ncbi:MAG: OmpH family outer membrane protein [Polyangiaceae bacterium]